MRARFILSLIVMALCGAVSLDVAAGTGSRPLAVPSALLTQDGQPALWRVTMTAPFLPARPGSPSLHTPRLVGCVDSGRRFVNHGPVTGRRIALTFDDGPWSQTAQFLTVLERYRVPATFFEVGEHLATFGRRGAIERRMLADGDMIGDHTWNHANVSAGGRFAVREISQTAVAIKQATHGFTPCLFRAPFGAVGAGLLRTATSLGFKTIQWDIDPRDWATPGVGAIYANVMANAHPGAIILQHDGGGNRAQTLSALPREITSLKARGYHFVTITQLLGMRLIYRWSR